jgi:hypothetical protein
MRPTNLRTLMESSATTMTRSCSTVSMASEGMLPRAIAVEPALARFCGNHAIQIDQQNKAAIGRNGRAREELNAAQVFAQVLDNDFVFAKNFFNDEANLPASGICHHHAEIPVDGFERR